MAAGPSLWGLSRVARTIITFRSFETAEPSGVLAAEESLGGHLFAAGGE